ncbi:7-deoxyloganetic acid glucosyltransferase-like isoform X1 [Silene latifolia]|uniref:7-deoxyloganetic acid glucosyltransferase-like isoform X1 n=1 Tax=Silene latifolia TaxID=37657 RepID=UPI003D76D731
MDNQSSSTSPHVIIFPLPAQGHITPMLNLAQLFCHANFQVTLFITTQYLERLTLYTDTKTRFAGYPGFRFQPIPNEPPSRQLTCHEDLMGWIAELVQGLAVDATPILQKMINGGDVSCMVVDGWLSFAYQVGNECGIPVISFRCPSACCVWAYFSTPNLIQLGQVPFQEEDMDKLVENVPGLDTFLRNRDLPSFCRTKDRATCLGLQQAFADEVQRTSEAYGLILNTFEDLEGPLLSLLRSKCPRVYSIGPLHSHLKHRLDEEKTTLPISSSSLWEVDQSCLSWLDKKPAESVIYVGFGSLTILEKEQILEIWEGLVQSNKYFLWVIRPNLVIGGENGTPTPTALLEGTKERGCIVSWAPQEAVLAHPAVGGFLTHSGWNSTLESITAGVPMLCWPYFADQQVNSRYVGEVWKIGLDMKDKCDRKVVAEMVNDVLDRKKDELKESMARMSEAAKKSVTEGGSSYCNLDRLIQDIKMMSIKGAD